MIRNRSVPANTLLPHLVYPDVREAVEWLTKTFGFREHYRYGATGEPSGAQIRLGAAWIMLRRMPAGDARSTSAAAMCGYNNQSLTVFLDDVDAHFERARALGANIVEDLHETEYGEMQYGVEDFAGHHWLFARHARDVSPEAWGAVVSERVAMPAQISPMLAVTGGRRAIDFYKSAFDATVLWQLGDKHVVAGLCVQGAEFFLADESPEYGTRGPSAAGFTTVRIELFVDDPAVVHRRALQAGATEHSPVQEHTHNTEGPNPIHRMLQGTVVDPFGHIWLVGKILE